MSITRRQLLAGASATAIALALSTRPAFAAVGGTAVFRVRTGGSNTNGAGYDASISGAGTDYSQQDAAQASGTHGTAAGTSTFTDATASPFTSSMIGNAILIASGSGFTPGVYFVTGFTSATTVTLDRSPGTGSAAIWALGGAWADPWTNTTATLGYIVPGNVISIRGSGSMFPASPDYTTSTQSWTPVAGTVAGMVKFIGENGRPFLRGAGCMFNGPFAVGFEFLKIDTTAVGQFGYAIIQEAISCYAWGCLIDQAGYDVTCAGISTLYGCEIYSSVPFSGSAPAVISSKDCLAVLYTNIHNVGGAGISLATHIQATVYQSILAFCGGDGITINNASPSSTMQAVCSCTIDNNAGHGISQDTMIYLSYLVVTNCLVTNHTVTGKYGIACVDASATVTLTTQYRGYVDSNQFFGNTIGDYKNMAYGATDVVLGSTPYAAEATQGYNPVPAVNNAGGPPTLFPQYLAGKTATTTFVSPGGVQP